MKPIVQISIVLRYKFSHIYNTNACELLIAIVVARESKTMSNKQGTRQDTVLVQRTTLNEPVVSITSDR